MYGERFVRSWHRREAVAGGKVEKKERNLQPQAPCSLVMIYFIISTFLYTFLYTFRGHAAAAVPAVVVLTYVKK